VRHPAKLAKGFAHVILAYARDDDTLRLARIRGAGAAAKRRCLNDHDAIEKIIQNELPGI